MTYTNIFSRFLPKQQRIKLQRISRRDISELFGLKRSRQRKHREPELDCAVANPRQPAGVPGCPVALPSLLPTTLCLEQEMPELRTQPGQEHPSGVCLRRLSATGRRLEPKDRLISNWLTIRVCSCPRKWGSLVSQEGLRTGSQEVLTRASAKGSLDLIPSSAKPNGSSDAPNPEILTASV